MSPDVTTRQDGKGHSPLLDHLVQSVADRAVLGASATAEFQTVLAYVTTRFHDVHEVVSAFAPRLRLLVDDQRARVEIDEPAQDAEGLLLFLSRLLTEATHGRFRVEERGPGARPAFEFARALLELPLGLAALSRSATGSPVSPATLAARVRHCVRQQLEHSGQPSLELVASRLGLTPRALQRGLQGGPPFQALLAEVYGERASFLLRERLDLSVKEIAARLGFSGTRAFSRAYRRWFGRNPSETRRAPAQSVVRATTEEADEEPPEEVVRAR